MNKSKNFLINWYKSLKFKNFFILRLPYILIVFFTLIILYALYVGTSWLPKLVNDNFFTCIIAALTGAFVGILGINKQNKVIADQRKVYYEYEKIIIPNKRYKRQIYFMCIRY